MRKRSPRPTAQSQKQKTQRLKPVGMIGLGIVGSAMAANLMRAGRLTEAHP